METTHKQETRKAPGWLQSSVRNVDFPPLTVFQQSRAFPVSTFDIGLVTDGFKNPNHLSQERNGQNATTSFSGHASSFTPTFLNIVWDVGWKVDGVGPQYGTRSGSVYGIMQYTPPSMTVVPGAVSTRVTNRCISQFLSACEAARSTIEGGQDVGEYKETLRSIHSPLHSLRSHILGYFTSLSKVRRRLRDPISLRKALADTYLEWRFGINPLISDVAKVIADAGRFRFDVIPVRAYASEKYGGSNSSFAPSTLGYCPLLTRQTLQSHSEYSVRYKGAIRSGADASGRISVSQAYQFTPENWLPTAWDLLPYSWIADYFTNIGDIIRSLSFVSSNLVWACKGSKQCVRGVWSDVTFTPLTAPIGFHIDHDGSYSSGGSAKYEYAEFSRSALTSSDLMPRFAFRVPTSPYPFLNMAALMLSRASRLVPFFT